MSKKIIKIMVLCLFLVIPLLVIKEATDRDYTTKIANSWDSTGKSTYVSAYLSKDAGISESQIYAFEEELKQVLMQSDAFGDGNVYKDAYYTQGHTTISSEQGNMSVNTFGVGGDFFFFHPMELSGGSYFQPEEQAHDLVVLDEDVAWQLFGSADVEGMQVEVNGIPHTVSGVVKKEEGKMHKLAGGKAPTIYLSYMSMKLMDEELAITGYDVVLPNITKGYGKQILKSYLGQSNSEGLVATGTSLGLEKDEYEIVDNKERFDTILLLKSYRNLLGTSMKKTTVIYPFWENVSRGVQDLCMWMLGIEVILLGYAVVKICILIRRIYVKKTKKIKIEAVIFDIGNVLAEFIPREYLRRLKFKEDVIDAMMESVIESEVWNEYDQGIFTREEATKRLISLHPELEKEIRKVFLNFNGIVKRFTYSDPWIEDLKNKGKQVYYLSNISDALYHDCRTELDFVDDTDGGILSFDTKMSKPDKRIYELLIDTYGLHPENCLFIDDRQANVDMANHVGFNGILFTNYLEVSKKIKKKYI